MINKNIIWHNKSIIRKEREKLKSHKAVVVWFTGLSGSGKSTIANALELRLFQLNIHTYLLDGDNLRHGINSDLGFDEASRIENIRRVSEIAKLFYDSGTIVLSAFISPFQKDRDKTRSLFQDGDFIEIFVDTPLNICEKRDVKGLYKKARNKEISHFTGIDSPYEKPLNPEIHIRESDDSIDISIEKIINYLNEQGIIDAK